MHEINATEVSIIAKISLRVAEERLQKLAEMGYLRLLRVDAGGSVYGPTEAGQDYFEANHGP